MNAKEPHDVLGLHVNATGAEIRKAYRQMALKWHPDRQIGTGNEDNKRTVSTFAEITNAYQTLIRDLDPPSTAANPNLRKRIPTPFPSLHSSASPTSVTSDISNPGRPFPSNGSFAGPPTTTSTSDSQLSTSLYSKDGSQTTNPSSFSGSSGKPVAYRHIFGQHFDNMPISVGDNMGSQASSSRYDLNSISPRRTVPPVSYPILLPENGEMINKRGRNTFDPRPPLLRTPIALHEPNQEGDPQLLKPGPPLQPLGILPSGEWAYSLTLTLEELFNGKHCRFCVIRHFLSGRSKSVMIEIDIPSGCHQGTRILCRGVGNQLPNRRLQDIVFIIEEAPHSRFSRVQDDLFLEMQLPWSDSLERIPKEIHVEGIDGEDIPVLIEYPPDKHQGTLGVRGAGMPIRDGGRICGRGKLIIRWEVKPPTGGLRKLFGRILHPRAKRTTVPSYP